jgi:short subunit dehydrogenase-like uncharacterized protein
MHLSLHSFELYGVVARVQAAGMRYTMPVVQKTLRTSLARSVVNKVLDRRGPGPSPATRKAGHWTLLAEARDGDNWRNVALSGTDVYGLTAETLSSGALQLAAEGHQGSGVMAPVQAIGLETLQKELIDFAVDVQVYEPV